MSERLRRVFSETGCAIGASIALDTEESHHVSRVLRLGAGDEVAVFDGRGGEWSATIESADRESVRIRVGDPRPGQPEPPVEVVLYQALVRPERIEWVLQKGTEIGVAAFRLVEAERSEVEAPPPARMDRYQRIVLEAVKQSGRRKVPEVTIGGVPSASDAGRGFILDTSRGAAPFSKALAHGASRHAGIAIGPEGGFTDAELARMTAHRWEPVSLGPRTLRTETAGVVAAAIVLHAWGDLGR